MEGYSHLSEWEYPARSVWSPPIGLDGGTPGDRVAERVLAMQQGMPLAFTQEDFLVLFEHDHWFNTFSRFFFKMSYVGRKSVGLEHKISPVLSSQEIIFLCRF